MDMNVSSYIDQLISVGRKAGCFETSDKTSEIMTLQQQEILTGHLIKESNVTIGDCVNFADEESLINTLYSYLLDDNERNAQNLLKKLKESAVNAFYEESQRLLEAALIDQDITSKKEAGMKAHIDDQTGETIWR